MLFVRGSHDGKLTDGGMLPRKRAEDILSMADKTAAEVLLTEARERYLS